MTSTTGRAFARLLEWDISTIKLYAIQKGLYTAEEIDAVEIEYKKYLALCVGYPKAAFPTPLKLDDLWHQHILFTQDYHAMCQSVCGKYLHHQPFVGKKKANPSGRVKLHAKYVREFGEQPNAMWVGANCNKCDGDDGGCKCGTGCANKCGGKCEPG
ncbi:MAG: glycine-rich domain-containing protein [Minisyncoccota bacterium]